MLTWEILRYLIRIREIARYNHAPAELWQRQQSLRLHELIQHAHSHSSLYRNHWGITDTRGVSLPDLRPVSKTELVGRLEEHMTARPFTNASAAAFIDCTENLGQWFQGNYCLYRTSGSQGAPLTIVQDRWTIRTVFACIAARSRTNYQPSLFELMRLLREPKRVAFITAQRGFFPSCATMHLLPKLTGRLLHMQLFSIMDPQICQQLEAFRPHAAFGYASSLDHLARVGARFGPQLEQINNSSEQLTEPIRQRLESTYQVPVLDHYGTGECLQLADMCSAGHMHINADWAILEAVDEQLRPVPNGTISSKVLITNLANRLQPFIRYVVDDRVCLDTSTRCQCGSSYPVLHSLHGRSSEQIVVHSATGQSVLLPYVLFQNVIDKLDWVQQWRVVQLARDVLAIEAHTAAHAPEAASLAQVVSQQLTEQGLPAFVKLQFRPLEQSVIDSRSGKANESCPFRWLWGVMSDKILNDQKFSVSKSFVRC